MPEYLIIIHINYAKISIRDTNIIGINKETATTLIINIKVLKSYFQLYYVLREVSVY